jgi:hypothetical protein
MTEPLETLQEAEDRYNALHQVLTLLDVAHGLLPDDADAAEAHEAIDRALAELERLVDSADKAVSEHTFRPSSHRPH